MSLLKMKWGGNERLIKLSLNTVTIGGRKYKTVKIGNQTWLAENLDFKFLGLEVGGNTSPNTLHAWYYNNDEATYGIDGTKKCGLLYNGYAVRYLEENKSIIPGWHVPTNDEWSTLVDTVGGSSLAGKVLKAIDNSATTGFPKNWDGTDVYGFGVLPGGNRQNTTFFNNGSFAGFWTSTHSSNSGHYRRYFTTSNSISWNTITLNDADSLRLIKDA